MKINVEYTPQAESLFYVSGKMFTKEQLDEIVRA